MNKKERHALRNKRLLNSKRLVQTLTTALGYAKENLKIDMDLAGEPDP